MAVDEKIHQGETVVAALIPGGDEIHGCVVCGGEINIDKDKDIQVKDHGYGKCAWHVGCEINTVNSNRSTLIRLE